MPVLPVRKPSGSDRRIQPQGKDRRSGNSSVDAAKPAEDDPFGEVSLRTGKQPDWKPEEGDCSGAADSTQRNTAADGREAGAILIVAYGSGGGPSTAGSSTPCRLTEERYGLGNPGFPRSKTKAKRTN